MRLEDYKMPCEPETDSPLTQFGLNQQRKLREMELKAAVMEERERQSMKNKLCKIAELFEMDVLSEEEALKACNTVIQQHAKVKDKIGRAEGR